MRRTRTEWIGALALLAAGVLLYVGLRAVLARHTSEDAAEVDAETLRAIGDFETARAADSLRQRAHWDSVHASWDAEREARQADRNARRQAYADSQRVWAERRRQWADEKAERAEARAERQAHYDSLRALRPEKLKRGATIEANGAEAADLQRVPGIGEAYAAKIVAYRERLGGFLDARQLDEIEGLPYGISAWFRVVPPAGGVRRMNLNRADFKTLNAHPYLTYEQTRAIVNQRRRAPLRSLDDLRGSGLFTDADVERLQPYCVF